MEWEVVIGIENHVQLTTESKIFSGSPIKFGAEPNTQASPVDLALPGVLPVMNKMAVERAIRFGLAVGGKIAPQSIFARKNYFYPDLPKGYQISQFEDPVVQGGALTFGYEKDGKFVTKTVNLTRAHLEEDAGKSLHEDYHGMSGIDLNRAGTPLLEIVSEPEIRSAAEAVAYCKALHGLVMWLGVCDGNMQEGSFRCDINVSVRPKGATEFGTRCEIKNLNSFRFIEEAVHVEVRRQIELIEDGGTVVQATRLYDPDKKETRQMRSKEDAQDYRYFPDPDLPPLAISEDWIARVKAEMPELPGVMRARFIEEYALPEYDALVLTSSKAMAVYFEAVVSKAGKENAKAAANWLMGDVSSTLNATTAFGGRPIGCGPCEHAPPWALPGEMAGSPDLLSRERRSRDPGFLSPAGQQVGSHPVGPGRGECVGKPPDVPCPHFVCGWHGVGLACAGQQRCRDLRDQSRGWAKPVSAVGRVFRRIQRPGDEHGGLSPARHAEFPQNG